MNAVVSVVVIGIGSCVDMVVVCVVVGCYVVVAVADVCGGVSCEDISGVVGWVLLCVCCVLLYISVVSLLLTA